MDKYKKLKVVGKGSFGYALLVQALSNKKYYIIKIIDISKMDRKQREEALNEVHVLKAMRHPYIITYRESFMEKKCLCIVMDYADGGDLYAKIAKQKEIGTLFPEEIILDWFVQMALAMNHIHERKILHRDLKTQNIFLTSKNDVKIGDFGIARVLQHTYDCAKTAIGTPYYLSPEICQEKPYNQKSDIWSLGCILYELTTLNHAFDAMSMKELVLKILRGTYPPIPAQYSPELQSLIADMLIKDPSKRPSIKRILERDFLKTRIGNLLVSTLNRHEFQELTEVQPKQDLKILQNISQNNSPNTQRQQQYQQLKPKSPIKIKHVSVKSSSPQQFLQNNQQIQTNQNSILQQLDKSQVSQLNIQKNFQSICQKENMLQDKAPKQINSQEFLQRLSHKVIKNPLDQKKSREDDSFESQGYGYLLKDIKKCLEKKASMVEEEQLVQDNFQIQSQFLNHGKQINVPGTSDRDTIGYKIEALRYYLEQQIGFELFMQVYQTIESQDSESSMKMINQFLNQDQRKYIPLIYQLIVCEDSYY
ncbi:hypothetical protein pb186bvf_006755 [Paramecium bursaria]